MWSLIIKPRLVHVTLTSLVASRTSTTSSGVGGGLRGGLGLDVALGAAHGGLVDRLHRAGWRFISLHVVTYRC